MKSNYRISILILLLLLFTSVTSCEVQELSLVEKQNNNSLIDTPASSTEKDSSEDETTYASESSTLIEISITNTPSVSPTTSVIESPFLADVLYGKWYIQRIAFDSWWYSDDYASMYIIEPSNYLGMILEFRKEGVYISDWILQNPVYNINIITVGRYEKGGKFKGAFYQFLVENEIILRGQEKYDWFSDVPMTNITISSSTGEDLVYGLLGDIIILSKDIVLFGSIGRVLYAERVVD